MCLTYSFFRASGSAEEEEEAAAADAPAPDVEDEEDEAFDAKADVVDEESGLSGATDRPAGWEQEQTKFYDLRRGITEDFQRLPKLNQKAPKRFTNFKRFAFLTFFDL